MQRPHRHQFGNNLFVLHKILNYYAIHYISYLLEAFLFLSVERYSPKARVRISAPRKIYAFDTGIANTLRFRIGADTGRLLENLVAIELYRRGEEFYSYKTAGGKEVDFLVRGRDVPDGLLQVCYDLSEPKTRRREFLALAKAGEELGLMEGTVLTWDEAGTESVGEFRIRLVPIWSWLLNTRESVLRGHPCTFS